jgi:hypothetical protein
MRKIRIANLPSEVHDRMIKDGLVKYGEVRDIKKNNGHGRTDTKYQTGYG